MAHLCIQENNILELKVSKYHGTGNDHILIDDRKGQLELDKDTIKRLCDRKFGIGSDGLILVRSHDDHDMEMVFYNPDASQSFCGNGSRCLMAFWERLIPDQTDLTFLAIDGVHKGRRSNGQYCVEMSDVELERIERIGDDLFINTGSPHYIRFVDDVDEVDLISTAHEVRYGARFKEKGTNFNLVSTKGETVTMRTYERGVENETLSCGTGVTAAAIAVAYSKSIISPCRINTRGGELQVEFKKDERRYHDIWLCGPAVHVFDATIEI